MNDGNVVDYLQRELRDIHAMVWECISNIKHLEMAIGEKEKKLRNLRVHYTSLLNTALAYEEFDREDFESGLPE
jgi:hypothetical protein